VFANHFTAQSDLPAAKQFVGDYEVKYGQKPDAQAALAYEAAMIVVDAIRRAGSTDPKRIRDALAATDLETITGRIKFDADRNPVKAAVLLEVKGNQFVYKASVNP
jgi:branched-chain amino acid transport system substrate-binding protein